MGCSRFWPIKGIIGLILLGMAGIFGNFILLESVGAEPLPTLQNEVEQPKQAKNLIMIVAASSGSDSIKRTYTPNINELARDGVRSDQAIGVHPPKNPASLASLFTGALPAKHNLVKPLQKLQSETLWQVFAAHGHGTLLVAGSEKEITELTKGVKNTFTFDPGNDKQVMDKFLEEWSKIRPLASLVYLPGPGLAARSNGYNSHQHLKAISEADLQIGRLVKALKDQGLYDDVLLVVTSDHGAIRQGSVPSGNVDQELLNPLIFRGPKVKKGFAVNAVRSIDVAPTIAQIFGIRKPTQSEGAVLWNILLPESSDAEVQVLDRRIKDLSQQILDMSRASYKLAEDKLTIDARVEALEEQKRQIEAFAMEKDNTIAKLNLKVTYQRYLVGALVGLAVIGFVIEYLVLRKRFMLFD